MRDVWLVGSTRDAFFRTKPQTYVVSTRSEPIRGLVLRNAGRLASRASHHPVDLLKDPLRSLVSSRQLADPVGMGQLNQAVVPGFGDRLGFGLAGNALTEVQQRGLTATQQQYVSLARADDVSARARRDAAGSSVTSRA